jgi:PAS domain S-box-containing protein
MRAWHGATQPSDPSTTSMSENGTWPAGGGEAGGLIRAHDWSRTPLGPVRQWPAALRTAVEIMLGSPTPIAVLWGPEHVQLYNDAYIAIAQERHPAAFGRPAREGWDDARESLTPLLDRVLAGGGPAVLDRALRLRGEEGERGFTAVFSPIPDGGGGVGGIFHIVHDTTPALHAAAALRESEDRLRLALAAAELGIWDHGLATDLFQLDARAQALYGLPGVAEVGALLGRVHPEDRERLGGEFAMAMDPVVRGPISTEYRVVHQDGVHWLRVRGRVYFADGEAGERPVRGLGTVQDVTEERRAVAALRDSEARQAFVLALSDRLRRLHDPAEIQYQAARALGEYLGAFRAGYAEDAGDGETLVITRTYSVDTPEVGGRHRYEDYGPALLGELRAGRTVVRPDVANDPTLTDEEKAAHAALQVGAAAIVPLIKQGRLVAVLFAHHRRPRAYTADDVALLETVADRTWAAVVRARAEAALRESEQRLRLALDVAELGTWTWDLHTGTGDMDVRGAEIVGLAPGQLQNVAEAQRASIHPDDLARVEAAAAAGVASGQAFDLLYRVIHPDGGVRHVASRARVVTDEAGRPARLMGTNRDVTAEREAEAALRRSEEKYRTLFETMDEGFCVVEMLVDGEGTPVDYRFVEANPAFTQQSGLVDAVGRTALELVPGLEPFWVQAYGRVALTGQPARLEDHAPSMGRWFDVTAFRIGEPHERRVAILFNDVSARKTAEMEREGALAALQVERERLVEVIRRAPAFMVVLRGRRHVLELVNDAYQQLIGHRDVVGKPLFDAVPEASGQGFEEKLDRVLETGEPFTGRGLPVRLMRTPGAPIEERIIDLAYVPLTEADGTRTGIVVLGTDVTEQVRARREIEAARDRAERLQTLTAALARARTLDDVADVVVADMVVALGARTGALAGRGPEGDALLLLRTIGFPESVEAGVRRQPLDLRSPLIECYLRQTPIWLEGREGPRGLDTRFPVIAPVWDALGVSSAAFVPLIAGGETVGVISFAFETPRVFPPEERSFLEALGRQAALAVERARLFEAEHSARAEAERANRAKSEFLAVMSHELRTPLNAIGGYAELMEMGIRGPITPQQREDLRRVQTSQRHLLGLINEVLNYAKLETGTVHYDVADVRLRDAIAGAEALVAPQAQARQLTLAVAPCPPALAVRGDAEKVRQILVNLLSNAVKFTDRGGRVEVLCEDGGDRVRVAVRDTGIGIPADQLDRIFEPFVQVRADLTRTAEGTGLGLAISRDLARGMGGDLTAESTLGAGSTFTLTLPRASS